MFTVEALGQEPKTFETETEAITFGRTTGDDFFDVRAEDGRLVHRNHPDKFTVFAGDGTKTFDTKDDAMAFGRSTGDEFFEVYDKDDRRVYVNSPKAS